MVFTIGSFLTLVSLVFQILKADLDGDGIADSLELFRRLFAGIRRAPLLKLGKVLREANLVARQCLAQKTSPSGLYQVSSAFQSVSQFVDQLETLYPDKGAA
jgi:hypothetical protein